MQTLLPGPYLTSEAGEKGGDGGFHIKISRTSFRNLAITRVLPVSEYFVIACAGGCPPSGCKTGHAINQALPSRCSSYSRVVIAFSWHRNSPNNHLTLHTYDFLVNFVVPLVIPPEESTRNHGGVLYFQQAGTSSQRVFMKLRGRSIYWLDERAHDGTAQAIRHRRPPYDTLLIFLVYDITF